jgi:hypothetical protein
LKIDENSGWLLECIQKRTKAVEKTDTFVADKATH